MPTPAMNCQVSARGPIQPGITSIAAAAMQPNSSGMPNAKPAATELSRLWVQAAFRSSSMPAIQTNSITAHQAMPLSDWITAGLKTKL